MKKLSLMFLLLFVSAVCYADTMGAITAITSAASLTWTTFLGDVFAAVQGFGGLSWALKIAVIVSAIIGLTKISALSTFWAKLGPFQAFLAPVLGLVIGMLTMGSGGITLAGLFAYMGSASGAVLLHELLEGVKAIPGLGATYVGIISMIEGILPAPLARKK